MRRPGGNKVYEAFADASAPDITIRPPRSSRQKQTSRLSVRVDQFERAHLEKLAGDETLSTYVRRKLLGDWASTKRERPAKRQRKPKGNDTAIAQLLALLGQSRLASNLNQIAKAANMGALPVTPDLEAELKTACEDIGLMRRLLVKALGIKAP